MENMNSFWDVVPCSKFYAFFIDNSFLFGALQFLSYFIH
ncbi:MAG: hypothetical protein RLZ22_263 [Verrucomicrobiota bacterium]